MEKAAMETSLQQLLDKSPPTEHGNILRRFYRTTPTDGNDGNSDGVVGAWQNEVRYGKCHLPFQVVVPDEVSSRQDTAERSFLISPYNQLNSDAYRSPWSNRILHRNGTTKKEEDDANEMIVEINHKVEDVLVNKNNNEEIRQFEVSCNEVWDAYKNLYYGPDAIGSVYIKEIDITKTTTTTKSESSISFKNIEGCFGIQKICPDIGSSWDSVSIVRINLLSEVECEYTVDTTVLVVLLSSSGSVGSSSSSSSDINSKSLTSKIGTTMTKHSTKTCKIQQSDKVPIYTSHIEHIGTIIEANEIDIRSNIERGVLPKNHEIISTIQKKKELFRPQVNPLMGMMMSSDMLKKRLQQDNSESQT